MSQLLLDTHVLLWAVAAPERLTQRAAAALSDVTNDLSVSAASAWEIATKHRLGRLPEAEVILHRWDEVLDRLGATPLVIDAADARRAGAYEVDHRDPFDRLLAAQAERRSLVLVTADRALDGFPVTTLW